MNENRNMTDD